MKEQTQKGSKIRQGPISKRSSVLKKWQNHWMVLTTTSIQLYTDSSRSKMTDQAKLKDIKSYKSYLQKVQDMTSSGFKIRTKNDMFYLEAQNSNQKWNWIVTIQRLLDYLVSGNSQFNSLEEVKTKGFPSQQQFEAGGIMTPTKDVASLLKKNTQDEQQMKKTMKIIVQMEQKIRSKQANAIKRQKQMDSVLKKKEEEMHLIFKQSQKIKDQTWRQTVKTLENQLEKQNIQNEALKSRLSQIVKALQKEKSKVKTISQQAIKFQEKINQLTKNLHRKESSKSIFNSKIDSIGKIQTQKAKQQQLKIKYFKPQMLTNNKNLIQSQLGFSVPVSHQQSITLTNQSIALQTKNDQNKTSKIIQSYLGFSVPISQKRQISTKKQATFEKQSLSRQHIQRMLNQSYLGFTSPTTLSTSTTQIQNRQKKSVNLIAVESQSYTKLFVQSLIGILVPASIKQQIVTSNQSRNHDKDLRKNVKQRLLIQTYLGFSMQVAGENQVNIESKNNAKKISNFIKNREIIQSFIGFTVPIASEDSFIIKREKQNVSNIIKNNISTAQSFIGYTVQLTGQNSFTIKKEKYDTANVMNKFRGIAQSFIGFTVPTASQNSIVIKKEKQDVSNSIKDNRRIAQTYIGFTVPTANQDSFMITKEKQDLSNLKKDNFQKRLIIQSYLGNQVSATIQEFLTKKTTNNLPQISKSSDKTLLSQVKPISLQKQESSKDESDIDFRMQKRESRVAHLKNMFQSISQNNSPQNVKNDSIKIKKNDINNNNSFNNDSNANSSETASPKKFHIITTLEQQKRQLAKIEQPKKKQEVPVQKGRVSNMASFFQSLGQKKKQ